MILFKNFYGLIPIFILFTIQPIDGTIKRITLQVVLKLFAKMRSDCVSGGIGEVVKNTKGCSADFDKFFGCWPPTPSNTTAVVRCPYILFNEGYTTRVCDINGVWAKANTFRSCKLLKGEDIRARRNELILKLFDDTKAIKEVFEAELTNIAHRDRLKMLQLSLRSIDLFICVFSLLLITWLVPLTDRRFILHRFLILAFALLDIVKILLHFTYNKEGKQKECVIEWIFAQYFMTVQVFMMFCEGFYQFRQFYFVFITESRAQSYIIFAYVVPIFIVFGGYVPAFYFDPPANMRRNGPMSICWQLYKGYKYAYIIYTPVFLLLVLNLLITIYMMNLIVTKLKREKSQSANKARKGARGFLVLLVLLGFGYMVTLYGPSEWWFFYFKNIVQSTQGLLVCLLQVFFSHQIINGFRKGKRRFIASQKVERQFNQSKRFSSTGTISSFGGDKTSRNGSQPSIHEAVKLEKVKEKKEQTKEVHRKTARDEDVYYVQSNITYNIDDFQEFASFDIKQTNKENNTQNGDLTTSNNVTTSSNNVTTSSNNVTTSKTATAPPCENDDDC